MGGGGLRQDEAEEALEVDTEPTLGGVEASAKCAVRPHSSIRPAIQVRQVRPATLRLISAVEVGFAAS